MAETPTSKTISGGNIASRPIRVMHVFGGRIRSGVETSVLRLAGGLRERGDYVVLTPLAEGPFSEEARDLGFTLEPLRKRHRYDLLSIPRLARLIRKHRVDLVHSHAVNGAFYGCPAGRLARVAGQVCHYRADTAESLRDVYRWKAPRAMAAGYHRWLTRYCQRVITVSPALRNDLIRRGVPERKVTFIPNAVDVADCDRAGACRQTVREELGVPAEAWVVGSAGRLAPVKDYPLLLRSAQQVLSRGESQGKTVFLIIGDGPQRANLKRLADELGIGGAVRFTGWRTDVPRLLSAVDIYVSTSRSEGMPNAVLEAMALAKPIISTDVGGMRELVRHQQTGLLVPQGDPAAIAGAIRALARDREQARRLGLDGRSLVCREFDVLTLIDRVRNVYLQVLEESAESRVPENPIDRSLS